MSWTREEHQLVKSLIDEVNRLKKLVAIQASHEFTSYPGDEATQDMIGAMVTGNTETGIAVTYDDSGAKLNFDAQTAGDARYGRLASTNTWSAVNTLTARLALASAALNITRTNPTSTNTYIYIESLNTDPLVQLWQDTNDANGPMLDFGKSRGTANQNNTIVQNGDVLGRIRFWAADGAANTSPSLAAYIEGVVNGSPSNNDMPGGIGIATTPDGTSTPVQRVLITQDGRVDIYQIIRALSASGILIQEDGGGNAIYVEDSTANVNIGTNTALGAKLGVLQGTLGSAVFSLQSTATNDDPTEIVYQNRVATTNATVTTLHTITIASGYSYLIEAKVIARRTGGAAGTANDSAAYVVRATVKDVAGTATLVGAVAVDFSAEDVGAYDCTIDVSGGSARVRVTGVGSTNISWHGTIRVNPLST